MEIRIKEAVVGLVAGSIMQPSFPDSRFGNVRNSDKPANLRKGRKGGIGGKYGPEL
jgi:hypothetical protein